MATLWNGTQQTDATTSLWNGLTETPATLAGMPFGYASADEMVESAPFYVAHRGGSLDWPEMSLRGMTESVAHGVGALEVSLARTSDGVWFGMHDETFARTAGLTTAPKGSEVTWAQVQGYSNGGDRYYTFQELVSPWAKSHTFFIDPKYAHTRMAELVPLIKSLLDPSRVVIKYFGDNVRLAGEARAAGFKSWGYFYAGDMDSGMFATNKGAWDYLGLSYSASAAHWKTITSQGKPVLGHIAPTRAAVDLALSRGAAGVMVSGIEDAFGQGATPAPFPLTSSSSPVIPIPTPGTTNPTPTPTPTPTPSIYVGNPLPALPTVKYETLYKSGDDLAAVVDRMTSRAVLLLPDGDFEWSDFNRGSGYGIYSPNLLGLGGNGRNRTRLKMRAKSSTKAAMVPTQAAGGTNQLNLMRVGEGGRQTTMFGMTIDGTDQGHLYNGLSVYKASNAIWQDLLLRGVNPGDYSSPPGETFGINSFRTVNFKMRNVEVDGRRADGTRVGGSPYGGNACDGDELVDCYFHDTQVSSVTWSFAGSPTNPDAPSKNITTRNLKVENNANHKMGSGTRFTGFNHENGMGKIRHYNPTVILDPVANSEWLTSHMVFVNVLADNPDIEIYEPSWANGSPLNRGCFVIKSSSTFLGNPNKQVSSPKVVKNGRVLEPYKLAAYDKNGVPSYVTPSTHYVHIVA